MRLTMDRRLIGLLAAAIVALAGCDNKPKAGGGGTETSGTGGTKVGPAVAGGSNARQAADTFLVALRDRTATPAQLTATFRVIIAPPGNDEEKKAGYSELNAREWIAQFRDANFIVGAESKFGDAFVVRGRIQFPGKAEAFSLRMVKGANGFQADWLHRSERQGSEIKTPADPDLAAAQDTVRNFLDVLLGGDQRQLHALMALDWKKRLAPAPPPEALKGHQFDAGFLTQTTRSWKDDYLDYTFSKQELGPTKDGATFTAELTAEGKKTSYTVQAIKDKATGQWLVTAFEKQS